MSALVTDLAFQSKPVSEFEPLPPVIEEGGPPILHPKALVVGDSSGPELLYVRRDGDRGVIYFEPTSVEIVGNRVNLSPKGFDFRYAIALDQIINPEILKSNEEGEEPPILHPKEFIIGDPSGPELLYVRRDGKRGVIYFEPTSIDIVGTRVNLNPKGIVERYAIALDQIVNPEILTPNKEPEPEVIHAPPEPEPIASTSKEGTRIILDEIPLDSFEAVQVMRRIKPEMGPFEIFDAFACERDTLLQGYEGERALAIGEELEAAGCTVSLQTVGPNTGTVIAEPPPQPKVMEELEPLVIESAPRISRPPTENEFSKIRSLGILGDVDDYTFQDIKWLIEATPIDVNARDVAGNPLVFGVHSTRILGLLMDRGADIHAKSDNGSSILDSMITSVEICKMLLQFGADINARGKMGWTPLIYAAIQGEYETAKILIEHGADIHVKDVYGETALQIAENQVWDDNDDYQRKARKGCEKIAALLREHGAK